METNTTKETLNVSKIICEKKEIINIQGDMIVPDAKPDILNTINTKGNISIYKKEIKEGKIKIDGNILTYIMYIADNSNEGEEIGEEIKPKNVRGLSTNLDFSEAINISELEEGMNVDIKPIVKNIECRIINGRKIGIKATVEIKMKIYSKETIEIITGIEDQNTQVLRKNIKINSLVGEGSTKASIKENISITNANNLAEILSAQANLVDKDVKISYNKILAKSEVETKIVYLTEEGKICTEQNKIPLVGFIDMPNIKEENICETTYIVKNLLIKPNSVEEHSVYIEMEVEILCIAYEEKEITTIQDMYCPGKKMKFDKKMINTISDKKCQKNSSSIKENLNVQELGTGSIVDIEVLPIINKENKLNGKIMLEGELEINLIFTDNSSVGINTKKVNIPFEQMIEEIDTTDNCKNDITIEISAREFVNQSGIINANLDLDFETNTYRNLEIPVISNITIDNDDDLEDYSVIIYVVKSGDTLWKIAKRFGSTVDDIVRVNGMENPNKLNVGEKIYIPKYVLNRSKEAISISQAV